MKIPKTFNFARKIVYIFFTFHFSLFTLHSFSQGVAINPTGGAADNSAMLDVSATNQGMRIPRVALTSTTSASPITNPANSLLVYDSVTTGDVTPGFYYWDTNKWTKLATGTGGWSTSGNSGTDTATNFIGTIDDRSWVMKTNNSERMKISKTGNVGIGTSNPASSAILDVSSTTKGQLLPRMTVAQRDLISSPAAGLQIYNIDCNVNEYYTGSCWVSMGKSLRAPSPITGTTVFCAGTNGTFSVPSVAGANSYFWSVPSGTNITSGQGTTSINVTIGNYSGNVCVNANNTCETSLTNCIEVTVNNIPGTPGNITGPTVVQRGTGTVTYSIDAIPGATSYNWTVPSGASIISGAGTPIIIVSFPCGASSGNISVTAQSSCTGVSASSTLAVTAGPFANAGANIFGGTYIGGTLGIPTAYSGQAPYYYSWTPTSGLSDPTVSNPLATPASTTTYTVKITDANNCSASSSMIVSIGANTVTKTNTSTGPTGTIQTWTVPAGVTVIRIEAYGAEGGLSFNSISPGKGAIMRGTFSVTPGNLLQIIVGQAGSQGTGTNGAGGGGGGTFVALGNNYTTADLLIAAGGGGGASGYTSSAFPGVDAVTSTSGTAINGNGSGAGGTFGNGGGGTTDKGAGGGGFLTNGVGNGTTEGKAFKNGGAGGTGSGNGGAGGFGGGGSSVGNTTTSSSNAGAGGGGYSGGAGGNHYASGGGGGGSYNSGTTQYNTAGIQTGQGKVVINY